MDKTLYDLMDWAGIEEIVYSEAANPHRMLGAQINGVELTKYFICRYVLYMCVVA